MEVFASIVQQHDAMRSSNSGKTRSFGGISSVTERSCADGCTWRGELYQQPASFAFVMLVFALLVLRYAAQVGQPRATVTDS